MTAALERVQSWSRGTKALLVGIVLLAIIGFSGVLRAADDVSVSSDQAVEIASDRLDFQPEITAVRLVREGIGLQPVWAVSFSVPGEGNVEFEELLVVSVDARSGEVLRVVRD